MVRSILGGVTKIDLEPRIDVHQAVHTAQAVLLRMGEKQERKLLLAPFPDGHQRQHLPGFPQPFRGGPRAASPGIPLI